MPGIVMERPDFVHECGTPLRVFPKRPFQSPHNVTVAGDPEVFRPPVHGAQQFGGEMNCRAHEQNTILFASAPSCRPPASYNRCP